MKKSKLLKSLGFASLAVFMGATALFTFAPLNNTPIVAGGLNASANTENQTFDLGLRPDTDPVVYVTESGLEIKKSNGKYTSTTTVTTNRGYSYTQDLTSFYYFTMGTFSGTVYTAKTQADKYEVSNEPVNWLIIGRGEFNFYDETPAGNSIENDKNKQEIAALQNYLPMSMSTIPEGPEGEIPDNCFLVISEKILGSMYFNAKGAINYSFFSSSGNNPNVNINRGQGTYGYGGRYRYISDNDVSTTGQKWTTSGNTGGSLYNYINSLFNKNNSTGAIITNSLGFTQTEADMIVPQQLYTYYYNGSHLQETPNTDGATYYTMFPLARKNAYSSIYQNFCIEDYLDTNAKRIGILIGSSNNQAMFWHTRSGNSTYGHATFSIWPSGAYNTDHVGSLYAHGVRPSFVIRIGG